MVEKHLLFLVDELLGELFNGTNLQTLGLAMVHA